MTEQQHPGADSTEPASPPVVRRVIDVGEGANPEVFEAGDLETLVDKLVESKKHATKHIRQVETENRELREKAETNHVYTFIDSHGDYENTEKNGELVRMKLSELRLPVTSENLHQAYSALKEKGLLTLKGQEKEPETPRREQPRAADVAPRGRRTSTISTHSRATPVPFRAEPSERDLYRMPMDDLRALADKQLAPH